MRAVVVPAQDGYPLAAHVFEPEAEARAAVLLPAAMGLRQDFYFPFASWLARIGHFGFFRESFRATLWPRVGDWLASR